MSEQEIVSTIKATIHALLPNARILLFGSRAKGNNTAISDYDLLIVTEGSLSDAEKSTWRNRLNKLLVGVLHAPVDILINSEKEITVKKEFPGHVVQWAIKEGVWL